MFIAVQYCYVLPYSIEPKALLISEYKNIFTPEFFMYPNQYISNFTLVKLPDIVTVWTIKTDEGPFIFKPPIPLKLFIQCEARYNNT